MKPYLKIEKSAVAQVNEITKKFKRDAVLIGIPSGNSERKTPESGSEINNATLLAFAEFGSAANNTPARPVLATGIRNAQSEITAQFKNAAVYAYKQGLSALDTYYNRVGIIASNSVKSVINDQEGILPPAQSTIRSRRSRGFKGEKALIVTGQMRNAITYVLQKGGL